MKGKLKVIRGLHIGLTDVIIIIDKEVTNICIVNCLAKQNTYSNFNQTRGSVIKQAITYAKPTQRKNKSYHQHLI